MYVVYVHDWDGWCIDYISVDELKGLNMNAMYGSMSVMMVPNTINPMEE